IPGHPFVTGQQVYYSSGLSAALGGLVNGGTYWIIRLDGNRIRLADSYCHAVGFAGDATCFNTVLDHYDEVDDGAGNITQVPVYVDVPILVQHLALTGDNSAAGAETVHKLYAVNARPLDGLVDGGQYH